MAENAQKQYVRSRGQPSPESVKRAKQLPQNIPMHPIFQRLCSEVELKTTHMLDGLKSYKPTQVLHVYVWCVNLHNSDSVKLLIAVYSDNFRDSFNYKKCWKANNEKEEVHVNIMLYGCCVTVM